MDLTLYNIKNTAKKVRSACEVFAWSDEGALFDFGYDVSLTGMCAIASFALRWKLQDEYDINVDITHGFFNHNYGHVWVEYNNKLLIDVTATQFNYKEDKAWRNLPKVYIAPVDNDLYHPEFGVRNDVDDFYLWPDTQRPHEGVIERVLELA